VSGGCAGCAQVLDHLLAQWDAACRRLDTAEGEFKASGFTQRPKHRPGRCCRKGAPARCPPAGAKRGMRAARAAVCCSMCAAWRPCPAERVATPLQAPPRDALVRVRQLSTFDSSAPTGIAPYPYPTLPYYKPHPMLDAPSAGVPVDSINRYAAEVRALEAKVLAEQQAVLQARRPPRALRVSVHACSDTLQPMG